MNNKGLEYNLIEDGVDMFKNNQAFIEPKRSLGTLAKKVLRVPTEMARSENIKSIEVNDKDGIAISHPNIIEVPRKELLARLSKAERKKIFDIFLSEDTFPRVKNSIIILTQPFAEDHILDSEEKQLKVYRTIIEEYCERKDKIIIKIHPRDHANYSGLADERVILVAEKFPIEILNFMPGLKFKKAITVSSTAINLLENCEERIYLGWGYLEKF